MAVVTKSMSNGVAPQGIAGLGAGEDGGVEEIQRVRLLLALTEVCAESGVRGLTVSGVVDRAGVSRRTFYEIFTDCEGCLLAAVELAVERATRRVHTAPGQDTKWSERVRAGLIALLRFFDEEPATGRLLVVETLAAGPKVLELRSRAISQIVDLVDEQRRAGKVGAEASRMTAEGVVGAVLSVLHARLLEGDRRPLVELANQLMSMIVLPYLGPTAARKELGRTVSKESGRDATASANPLKNLEMRLTYRTLRVLSVVATNPGSSNRTVGEASGISDQGQTSKLLTRLTRLGLIETAGRGSNRGVPNAWKLTTRGEELHKVIVARTSHA
jgi:AcrR family transcriptional regulator